MDIDENNSSFYAYDDRPKTPTMEVDTANPITYDNPPTSPFTHNNPLTSIGKHLRPSNSTPLSSPSRDRTKRPKANLNVDLDSDEDGNLSK